MGFLSNRFKKNDSINSSSPVAVSEFSNIILNYINDYYDETYDELLIVCIGTDRSTGDCLGPLIGHKLSTLTKDFNFIHVLGTLENPVHAKNLSQTIEHIKNTYINPFVIAIDASLGSMERIGYISVTHGPLKPGAGVNKNLPTIGNIHITGVVNLGGFMEYVILQNTRLNVVMKMAEVISEGVLSALYNIRREGSLLKN